METKEEDKKKRKHYMSATHSLKAIIQNAEMLHKHKLLTDEQLKQIQLIHTEVIDKWITRKFKTNYDPNETTN